jgi:L-fuconolactonase
VIIDAHQHFWRVDRGDYGWIPPDDQTLYRDYLPADLEPHLAKHGVEGTILVQAAPTSAETDFLLGLAKRTPFVFGVVGWADFDHQGAPSTIARLAENPLLVGLRPMVQDIPDDDWLLRPELDPAFRALVDLGLVFDALVLPRHLSRLLVVLDRYPTLKVVVDHAAKPRVSERRLAPWRAEIEAVAAHPNAVCKLSGLVTEAGPSWGVEDLRPYVDYLLASFGPDRLIWGSDWPVVNRAGGYELWWRATDELLRSRGPSERTAVLGGNAARVYLASRGRT